MRSDAYSVHRFRRALLQFVGGRLAQAAARAVLVLALVRVLPIVDYGAYMLIVGNQEMASDTVSLRRRDVEQQNDLQLVEFAARQAAEALHRGVIHDFAGPPATDP